MIDVSFYACHVCGKTKERRQWEAIVTCPKCGSKRFHLVYLNTIRLIFFALMNPSYVIKGLKGE